VAKKKSTKRVKKSRRIDSLTTEFYFDNGAKVTRILSPELQDEIAGKERLFMVELTTTVTVLARSIDQAKLRAEDMLITGDVGPHDFYSYAEEYDPSRHPSSHKSK
jgi:hypothetical protein